MKKTNNPLNNEELVKAVIFLIVTYDVNLSTIPRATRQATIEWPISIDGKKYHAWTFWFKNRDFSIINKIKKDLNYLSLNRQGLLKLIKVSKAGEIIYLASEFIEK